jgi:hypothetical protein
MASMPPDPSHSNTNNKMTNETQPSPVAVDTDDGAPDGNAGAQSSDEVKNGALMESPKNSTLVDADDLEVPKPLLQAAEEESSIQVTTTSVSGMIVQTSNSALQTSTSSSSQTNHNRIPFKYDPEKITLRFLFANRDGLTVTITCKPSDTVGEVKGALISVWPTGEIVAATLQN